MERSLPVFHIPGPGRVMLPLDQGCLVADVTPDSVRKTVSLTDVEARSPGLFLDCLEEFVLVDFAVKLPEHFFARVVT